MAFLLTIKSMPSKHSKVKGLPLGFQEDLKMSIFIVKMKIYFTSFWRTKMWRTQFLRMKTINCHHCLRWRWHIQNLWRLKNWRSPANLCRKCSPYCVQGAQVNAGTLHKLWFKLHSMLRVVVSPYNLSRYYR